MTLLAMLTLLLNSTGVEIKLISPSAFALFEDNNTV
jgi:hypothetical protein